MYLLSGIELNSRYKIEGVLGHGGFGITYSALDKVLNVKVAVKEYLPRQLATRAEGQTKVSIFTGEARKHYEYGLKKFLEEAQSVAQFSHHPNIVSARDYFEANGTAYMVMEYVEGVTLKEYLKKKGGRLAFEEAKGIMMPVMDALREVHQAGMLHRDVSPDNIYITTSAQVKILDFGAARYFAGEQSKSLSVILKTGYAPAEQYRSKGKQGPWTDIYATAATLYKAITGVTPPDALDRRVEDTLASPSRLGVSMPPIAERALLQALAVNAGQRFQSMGEFQQALKGGLAGTVQIQPAPQTGYTSVSAPQSHYPQRPRKLLNPATIAGGVLVTILLAAGLIWWQVGRDSSQRSGVGAQKEEVKKPDTPKPTPALVQAPTPPRKESPPAPQPELARFTKCKDGIISDRTTGLEWFVYPDKDTTWNEAKTWTKNLTVAGGGWRMPIVPELGSLFHKGAGFNNIDPVFKPSSCWAWSGDLKDAKNAFTFNFVTGNENAESTAGSRPRAFAVRARNADTPMPPPEPVKTRFTKAENGVISDSATGLEWYPGPDRDTKWDQGQTWLKSLTAGGGSWRMPTCGELGTLYQAGAGRNNIAPIFKSTGKVGLASEARFSYSFVMGSMISPRNSLGMRAFAVRPQGGLRFTKARNGVISDRLLGLEWYVGPKRDTTWNEAKTWAKGLPVAGGGWRLPTVAELKSLSQEGADDQNLAQTFFESGTAWSIYRVWADQLSGSSAWNCEVDSGMGAWDSLGVSDGKRAFAVRSRK